MDRYLKETLILLAVLSVFVVPDVLLPVQWAATLIAVAYLQRLDVINKDDTPDVKRFREELKDLKAKVDAMIVGGRIRG